MVAFTWFKMVISGDLHEVCLTFQEPPAAQGTPLGGRVTQLTAWFALSVWLNVTLSHCHASHCFIALLIQSGLLMLRVI